MILKNYKTIIVQKGKSETNFDFSKYKNYNINFQIFDYCNNISDYMKNSDLIICHGGR